MKAGVMLRNWGPAATVEILRRCAQGAEAVGLEQVWVADHVAIPPDDAEGSGGRYIEPFVTLSYLGAITSSIKLGTGVLVLPHRTPLSVAKSVASLQELSGGRFTLGVGVGAMRAEYTVTGVPWERRGAIANESLRFLRNCFDSDVCESNGQQFLFRPRPECPDIFVGGDGPHAICRVLRYADGWFAPVSDPEWLRPRMNELLQAADEAGRLRPSVAVLFAWDRLDIEAAVERVKVLGEMGVEQVVITNPYESADEFSGHLDRIEKWILPALE